MKRIMRNDTVELVLEEKSRKVFGRTDRDSFYTGVKLSKDLELNQFVLDFLLEAHTRIKHSEDPGADQEAPAGFRVRRGVLENVAYGEGDSGCQKRF